MSIDTQITMNAPKSPGTREPTLLIVDDDQEVRIIIAEFLEDSGYRVLQAEGGARALALLESYPETRMVVTDIRMPDMSGLELADHVTQRWDGLKIILISGYSDVQPVSHRFLRKPFRMHELAAAIEAELG